MMLIKNIFNKIFPCKFNNQSCKENIFGCSCGFWGPIIASAISTAGSLYGANKGSDDQVTTQDNITKYTPEAQQAQKSWWQKLSEWGQSGDYGATDMNWDDIFKSAEKKINQYYWGGVGTTGLAGKVKASAARRNASQSPALENSLGLLGMQESNDLSDLITKLTTEKANYQENARKSWLASLMELSGLTSGSTSTTTSPEDNSGWSSILGSSVSSLLSSLSRKDSDEENSLLNLLNTNPSSLTSANNLTFS